MTIPFLLLRDMGPSPLWWKCIWMGRGRCLVQSKERMSFSCCCVRACVCVSCS